MRLSMIRSRIFVEEENKEENPHVAGQIDAVKQSRKISQNKAAGLAGISKGRLSQIRSGEKGGKETKPSVDTIQNLNKVGIHLDPGKL